MFVSNQIVLIFTLTINLILFCLFFESFNLIQYSRAHYIQILSILCILTLKCLFSLLARLAPRMVLKVCFVNLSYVREDSKLLYFAFRCYQISLNASQHDRLNGVFLSHIITSSLN